ncbi:GNAT family N-acetyltransferase [Emcibacter sp. SYSU 3D8]|uniref:GNAT family N-acetyltransferase n=1 Tax=Emcibacter sp. SYSU 3D8 TaxID=3133969 RepID=UPI0031FEA62E
MTEPTIAIESPDQPDVKTMFEEARALYINNYPDGRNRLPTIAELSQPDTLFWVVRENGRAIGCGALTRHDGWAEIKRMYVVVDSRRRNIGALILDTIEDYAEKTNIPVVRLETGERQSAAISLYRSRGYKSRGPFGDYADADNCLFMEKQL